MSSFSSRFSWLEPDVGAKPRILFFGTCSIGPLMVGAHSQGIIADHQLFESYAHYSLADADLAGYDAAVVALTLRHIFIDATQRLLPKGYHGNCLQWPRLIPEGREQEYFDICADLIETKVDQLCGELAGKPLFFLSFIEPKHNYLGNLLPRYRLSNPVYFIERMNQVLAEATERHAAAHFFDVNEIIALVGRGRVQDDYVQAITHASYVHNMDGDQNRIQPVTTLSDQYGYAETMPELSEMLIRRLRDNIAILRQPLKTKAIIVDLDDTMWRGIAAEEDKPVHAFTEGWPLGMAEALLVYKARGGMIAICSKNDPEVLAKRFFWIYHDRIKLEDFASIRINYQRKSQNIAEILEELNILPQNALFIDDNPVEIAEVRSAFPDMQYLSADHYNWRRHILMSPDTQVAKITEDAALRTRSVQAQAERKKAQVGMSHAEWLAGLWMQQEIVVVDTPAHPRFDRAFELLNKTNQFNTTGKRWEQPEIEALLARGGTLLCSMVKDRITDHGMVSVLVIEGNQIVQAVLSCRAFGNSIEIAAGRFACLSILREHGTVQGGIIDTGRNKTCHGWFTKMGFTEGADGVFTTHAAPEAPSHITVTAPPVGDPTAVAQVPAPTASPVRPLQPLKERIAERRRRLQNH